MRHDQDEKETQERLLNHALHALNFFTFQRSTPKRRVSKALEDAFFDCLPVFPILSCSGVLPSSEVCLPDKELEGFLKHLVVLPDRFVSHAQEMLSALKLRKLVHESVPHTIIANQLLIQPLQETEAIACLRWWIGSEKAQNQNVKMDPRRAFDESPISAATLSLSLSSTDTDKRAISLANIEYFVGRDSRIPMEGPLPGTVLPPNICHAFDPKELESTFGWSEFSVEGWVGHIALNCEIRNEDFHLSTSSRWAERVLNIVAQSWPTLTATARDFICETLSAITCIPTTVGMMRPPDAYSSDVIILPDLPIAQLPSSTAMSKLLDCLGLKKHVELERVLKGYVDARAPFMISDTFSTG
jgi:Protein of unknown function (DUF3684)